MSRRFLILLLACVCVPGARVAWALNAQYEFRGDLSASGAQEDLEPTGYPGVDGAPGVTFATDTIGGEEAQVAEFTRGTAFLVRHGAAANGGGTFVNLYTIIMDVKFPEAGNQWISLYQTNNAVPIDGGNDGDAFLNPSGDIGISGQYAGNVSPDWHRLGIVVDPIDVNTITLYIDGAQVNQVDIDGLDGRWTLYTADAEVPIFMVFADESGGAGEMGGGSINSLYFEDRAFTSAEMAALGGPSAAGIGCVAGGYFADNFDSYAADADVMAAGWQIVDANAATETATWTITNPGGRRNPPTLDGAPSTGNFLISDSDAAGGADNLPGSGMSHDLITPSFSTTGGSVVWLHAGVNAQLNNNGEAIFDVDVSIDGGASWTNVFRRVAPERSVDPLPDNSNSQGFFGQLDVDLSALAADQADVQVRFRHFEPHDDWWIAVDDVVVDCNPAPASGDCEVLFEDFSSGFGVMTATSGAGNSGTETWHTTDKGGRYTSGAVSDDGVSRLTHPDPDPNFAIVDSDADPDQAEDEFLRTPALNLATFTEVILEFKSETRPHEDATAEVLLSVDGGATFPHRIFRYSDAAADDALFERGEDPLFAERAFRVPEAAGEPNAVFAFHYASDGDKWWWAVDDIRVSGTAEPCVTCDCSLREFSISYDAATNEVTGTWNPLACDSGFRVMQGERVVVEGLAGDATSFMDGTPPPGGTDVVYTLQALDRDGNVLVVDIGGTPVEQSCSAGPIQTFVAPGGFACRPDQDSKTVALSWTPGVNLDATGLELSVNGEVIAMPGLDDSNADDVVTVGEEKTFLARNYELATVGGATDVTLACRALVSTGNVCFADDFEDYADDLALEIAEWFPVDENMPEENAKWTITNPGARSNPPTFDGKPSTGGFVISDSDAAGGSNPSKTGMSHDLWSPPIDLCGDGDGTEVWLHMDTSLVMNNNGVAVFDVDLSFDGGVTWQNVLRRVAPCRRSGNPCGEGGGYVGDIVPEATNTNADGFFGRLDVDLTAAVAGQSSFRFRARHFEPNDDWWIAIDNVIVDDVAPPQGGAETVFSEDFSDGLGQMTTSSLVEPPNAGAETWSTLDKGGRYAPGVVDQRNVNRIEQNPPGDAGPPVRFAILDSDADPDPPEDEFLVTPALDLSNSTRVFLHWSSETVVSGDQQEVLLSLDGGATFTEQIFSYRTGALIDTGEEPFFAERVMEVPAAAGQSDVAFAFHWSGDGDDWWWAVDNVKVTATSEVVGPIFRRGDVNGDGLVDVSDPIANLSAQFLGQGVAGYAGCLDAADTNDDGKVDVSDPITNLSHQFLGMPTDLAAPGKICGLDETPDDADPADPAGGPNDELGCEEYPNSNNPASVPCE